LSFDVTQIQFVTSFSSVMVLLRSWQLIITYITQQCHESAC